MKALGCVFVFLITAPATATWRGYVLSILWRWFIVPTFRWPELSVPVAIGISIVAAYLTHQYDAYEKPDSTMGERFATHLTVAILKPAFALLSGWIILQFV